VLTRISLAKIGRAFILGGALALACWAYLMFQELWFQRAAGHLLESQMLDASGVIGRHDARQNHVLVQPRRGDIIGRIEIPRIHLSVIVLEGSDSRILRVGAGHVQGTALPGAVGNVGIAAHRDTFFRPLREIRPADMISLTTTEGVFRYRVERTEIVDPNNVQVLGHSTDAELTLITCYPFYYIGSSPKRFIVHARQQS
jgi:sortase A